MKASLVAMLVLSACVPATVESEGPSITVKVVDVDGFTMFASDSAFTKTIDPDSTTMNYDFKINVDADFGGTKTVGKEASLGTSYAQITTLTGTVTPPGISVALGDFTVMVSDILGARQGDYTGTQTISIPASSAGQMVMFHLEAVDSEGLDSNVVDFTAVLGPP
jgi:hypothetical protein